MIPRFMSSAYVNRPRITEYKSTHYGVKLSKKDQIWILKRDARKHSQNCYKRQKIMIKLQEMIFDV